MRPKSTRSCCATPRDTVPPGPFLITSGDQKPTGGRVLIIYPTIDFARSRILTHRGSSGTGFAFVSSHGRRDRENHGAGGAGRRGAEPGAWGAGGGAVGGARHAT